MTTLLEGLRMKAGAAPASEAARVLIADDQPHILDALELLLAPEG